jgi:hypothetical protein
MRDYISVLQQASAQGDGYAEIELGRLEDTRHYNNQRRKLRRQHMAVLTCTAANEIRQHLKARGWQYMVNDVLATHRRLKIGEDAAHALGDIPLQAIAVNHQVQITLDTVSERETLYKLTVRRGRPQHCLRIKPTSEPSTAGQPDVNINI